MQGGYSGVEDEVFLTTDENHLDGKEQELTAQRHIMAEVNKEDRQKILVEYSANGRHWEAIPSNLECAANLSVK